MDVNATMRTIREIQARIAKRAAEQEEPDGGLPYEIYDEQQEDDREALVSAYEALDKWMCGGGFPPDEWAFTS